MGKRNGNIASPVKELQAWAVCKSHSCNLNLLFQAPSFGLIVLHDQPGREERPALQSHALWLPHGNWSGIEK